MNRLMIGLVVGLRVVRMILVETQGGA